MYADSRLQYLYKKPIIFLVLHILWLKDYLVFFVNKYATSIGSIYVFEDLCSYSVLCVILIFVLLIVYG
jgi:hypothetical protein